MKRILLILVMLTLAIPAVAVDKPGKGVEVKPGRATWNTGYFQEALVRAGLTELGYEVENPKELTNPLFYQSLALGDLDYWTNGWFPIHYAQMPKNYEKRLEPVGYVAKAGGLQGYLVSKRDVEKYNIKSLDDFKRPEVKKAFDANGDGKADLTACPPGWGCEKTIAFHMDAYDLGDHINLIKAGYSASIADALGRYQAGNPVFFYTWAPNWTIFKLKPGEDVLWMNVPEVKPTEAQKAQADRLTASGIVGAVTDPVKLGFIAADIRIVGNKRFMENNPAAKKFFEVFTLPLSDINEQNTRMENGEKSQQDVERHAQEWIAKNKATWDGWLTAARSAAK
ncbi:MAG: proline/glycine betaine ABC transporter substrate-binding protein ProX [Desulfuromonas sp.]|nr:MAG: proline/glycine betaine ABC transporter substrate-binding protein ProX [Desulfuromonas sp.]